MKNNILRTITKDALINWDYEHETMEEKIRAAEEKLATMDDPKLGEPITNDVVYGSVESAINGLKEILELDASTTEQLRADIVLKGTLSPRVADKIKESFSNSKLLDVLSLIHDGWVKENGNKFEGRPKNYQFSPLELLPFSEATADLLFIKPILEAAGINLDMNSLEKEFLSRQRDFITENQITSAEVLKEKLQTGAAFYPALKDVTTNKGDKEGPKTEITELLKDEEIAMKMAEQIEGKSKLVYTEGIYQQALFMVKEHFLALKQRRVENQRTYKDQENRCVYASSGKIAYFYDEAIDYQTKRSLTFYVLIAEPLTGKVIIPEEMETAFFRQEWNSKAKAIWQLRGDYRCGFQFQRIDGRHRGIVYTLNYDGTVTVKNRDAKGDTERIISLDEFLTIMPLTLDEILRNQTLDSKSLDDDE